MLALRPLRSLLPALFAVLLAACPGGDGGGGGPQGAARCGDGVQAASEACDDGNAAGGDGCSSSCALEDGFVCTTAGQACRRVACGDGLVDAPEACDDANTAAGDGCSSACAVEAGFVCPPAGGACHRPVCSDGKVELNEECDDHNATNGDGCSSACRIESGYKCTTPGQACEPTVCGDGKVEGTEQCDNGKHDWSAGCDPSCQKLPSCTNGTCQDTCGDGVMLPGSTEECDDGNLRSGDGCSATCTKEAGFTCTTVTDAPPASVEIPIVYRDFRRCYDGSTNDNGGSTTHAVSCALPGGHPDFNNHNPGAELGIVGTQLGADGKPVYAKATAGGGFSSTSTHGSATFDQWYRDVDGVNKTVVSKLKLDRSGTTGSTYVFNSDAFFPLDAAGFVADGSEKKAADGSGVSRNFGFTSEARYWFEFKGGEVLNFLGDDDVWVFINGQRAVDLGGVHGPQSGTATLTADASGNGPYGMKVGKVYEAVVFQAERHVTGSKYQLTLTNFTARRTQCVSLCGNGKLDGAEQCDDGKNDVTYGPGCAPGCVTPPRCGDGVRQADKGEECDDGNTNDLDACSNTCKVVFN